MQVPIAQRKGEGLSIRLVSINIWDLPIPLPRANRRLRRRRLLTQLSQLDADIFLIQEAFVPRFKQRLAAAKPEFFTDDYLHASRHHFPLTMDRSGGLLTLSRWPIGSSWFQPTRQFRGMKPDERIGRKGCLWARIDTPAGPLLVGNVHLYAGNTPIDARVRTVQIRQLINHRRLERGFPSVMAGDFNMAIEFERAERGVTGFDVLAAAGFGEISQGKSQGIATRAPRSNRYARYVPWHLPDRRLTQVFYRGPGIAPGSEPPRLCLYHPPVSDHFGLQVTLSIPGS